MVWCDSSRDALTNPFSTTSRAVLFPAGFGVAVGEKFDDMKAIPKGTSITRIKRITVHYGAWIDSLNTTYLLSDGSEYQCKNGPQGGKIMQYEFEENEVLLALGGLLGFIKNTDLLVGDLMIDYLQFHIKNINTGEVRVVPEDPESYGSSQGADFFVQGPIIAFAGRLATYLSQIQPYLTREKSNIDFGLPQPGVAFDDRRSIKEDSIKRIVRFSVYSGAWIEGLDIVYELHSGQLKSCTHGTTSGVSSTTVLADHEYIDAISVCNSGPFPFCDAIRFYLTTYGKDGEIVHRRTVPDKSSPAYGYEYDYGENLWIRVPKGSYIFAFAGKVGSYLEEIACWVRDTCDSNESRIEASQKASNNTILAITPPQDDLPLLPSLHRMDEHRRSYSTTEGFPVSNSLNALQNLALYNTRDVLASSPQSLLVSSIPSSPSLPTSLGRLSACSSSGGDLPFGDRSPRLASSVLENKRKRLSGQSALKHGDELQRQQRRSSENCA